MPWLSKVAHYARSLFRKRRLDEELSAEVTTHVEMATEANVAKGMAPEEARYAALREFGNVAGVQERVRDVRGWVWLEQFGQDLRYSATGMRKNPGFTAVVVLTLALGLGVNTALFTWFNAIAFRPLPVLDPGQLFAFARFDENGNAKRSTSYAEFTAYREQQTVFSGLTASGDIGVELVEGNEASAATGEGPVESRVGTVASNYFTVYGVPMALGRPLLPTDENSSRAQPVIVLSHQFWERYFNADPGVVGRTIRLRGLAEEVVTVVGVTGPEFYGTRPGALMGWVSLLLRSGDGWRTDRRAANYVVTGRLRPGISREQAIEEVQAIARRFPAAPLAGPAARDIVTLLPASTYIALTARDLTFLLPIVCLFGVVLVVSAANASNLILARAVTRQFEFAVRSALGASRRRLFAQVMTESLVLGALGGVAGWLVSAILLRFVWPWLVNLVPGASEGLAGLNLSADHRIVGFTLAVSLLAGLVGGLLPALRVTRRSVDSALKREGSSFGRKLSMVRIRNFLAVVQLALSAALLFTTGLLAHRALGAELRDMGFEQSRLVTFEALAPRTFSPAQLDAGRRQALERLRALPAVAAISEMPRFPFGAGRAEATIPARAGVPARPAIVLHLTVPANYFSTLQLPLLRGRGFLATELAADHIAVITESAARAFWPGQDALGKSLELPAHVVMGTPPPPQLPNEASPPRIAITVVGIVRDTRAYDPGSGARPIVFLPVTPGTEAAPYLLIRTHEDAERSLDLMRQVGREATTLMPRVNRVSEVFDRVLVQYRAVAYVAAILAGLSLIVAVIGLHGVMTFAVNQREKEIGIRMALGATPRRVVSAIVGESLRLVAAGTVAGYGLSLAISVFARSVLMGVKPGNPWVGAIVALVLALIGLVACWLPARRAAKVDPMVALRAE
ncbi:MAG TPA: ADOP family duplicated permease [Lacunisphaera sp.]|nr:ADOP family duplicated permease [Lacunisphaera sp.]